MQFTEQQHTASSEIVELIAKELGENRAVDSVAAISSCARLTGSFMFRSFNLALKDVKLGNVVLSEEANEKWPELVNIVAWKLSTYGIEMDSKKVNDSPIAESKFNFLDNLNLLQNKAAAIMNKNKLDFEQMAYSCAVATAFVIKECQHDLTLESGFNTAIYGIIEGCKTYPPDLSDKSSKKKSIFSFWK